MVLFYTNNIQENIASFEAEESRHIQLSLRKRDGEQIHFVDGLGNFYEANIIHLDKRQTKVEIQKTWREVESDSYLHIGIAPTKQIDRIEWFLEKAVEIGVQEISFLQCKHSERKVLKMDRMQRIAIAAMKQSLKASIPKLNPMLDFNSWVQANSNEQSYIATLHPNTKTLLDTYKKGFSSCVAIGPEGGFRQEEVDLAQAKGFIPVELGRTRLRTETAGIYALSMLHFLQQ